MITNERQYKITRAEAERFREALNVAIQEQSGRVGVHPALLKAEREALQSQLNDLEEELRDYESLKHSAPGVISVSSFEELADGLIKARIAAGLTQKDLAEKMGLKEQQIQRYEADRYGSASYQRLQEVSRAIGVKIRNDIFMPSPSLGFDGLLRKLQKAGLDSAFIQTKLMPSSDVSRIRGEAAVDDESAVVFRVGKTLERIYGWSDEAVFGEKPLEAPRYAAAEARFKMPARRSNAATSLYAAYANYLAVVVLRASENSPITQVPEDPLSLRKSIVDKYGVFNLKSAVNYSWDLGVPVLPLRDGGGFHGACWRYQHRNVVVLKQNSPYESRWLFDLFHELYHASQSPNAESLELVELPETADARRNSEEEIAAGQFAGDVCLNGQAEILAKACVSAAAGSVERLKRIVPEIAEKNSVGVDALSNYMAFRLSLQGINWWGTAARLQGDGESPWETVRDVFFRRFSFLIESDIDRQLLDKALR